MAIVPIRPTPTGREVRFGENELIVSKTDLKGRITYANDVFERVSGYTAEELIGAPHNLIRHPAMPRCVFHLLWDTIAKGEEIFAYVLNLARSGDEYWVFAHVTPSFDPRGVHVGYHSNRRVPHGDAIAKIKPIYAALCAEERKHADRKDAIRASTALLVQQLGAAGLDYSQFVFSLSRHTTLEEVSA
ncbi:MAG: PAS domain S-box protein [Acidobacteria bacterium]|nr:PAS domain S-box protein [Acidobacteriota bacterium]